MLKENYKTSLEAQKDQTWIQDFVMGAAWRRGGGIVYVVKKNRLQAFSSRGQTMATLGFSILKYVSFQILEILLLISGI